MAALQEEGAQPLIVDAAPVDALIDLGFEADDESDGSTNEQSWFSWYTDSGHDSGFSEFPHPPSDRDPPNRSYLPAPETQGEQWRIKELGSWLECTDALHYTALEAIEQHNFEAWIECRREHERARHCITMLLRQITNARRGTHRQWLALPHRPERLQDFGNLEWLPVSDCDPAEEEVWAEYQQLFDQLSALRTDGAHSAVIKPVREGLEEVSLLIEDFSAAREERHTVKVARRRVVYDDLIKWETRHDEERRATRDHPTEVHWQSDHPI